MSNIITEYEYTSTDYEKLVPADISANDRAIIEKIGGATKKCANLFDISRTDFVFRDEFTKNYAPKVENGILYSGGVHQTTEGGTIPIYLKPNTDYTFSCEISSEDAVVGIEFKLIRNIDEYIYESSSAERIFVKYSTGKHIQTFNSGDYKAFGLFAYSTNKYGIAITNIQINEGTTALPYEPYYEGLRHAKVERIDSIGANLIPFPYLEKSQTRNGVTFTVNDDGSVKVKGTATSSITFFLARNINIPTGTSATISGGVSASDTTGQIVVNARKWTSANEDVSWIETPSRATGTLGEGERHNSVSIYIGSGLTVDATIYPMLNYGTAPAPYKPYKSEPIDSITIPEAVKALDGYGKGVNDTYHNYIEVVDDKVYYHKVCEEIVLNGTEKWMASDTSKTDVWRLCIDGIGNIPSGDAITIPNLICNKYEAVSAGNTYGCKQGACVYGQRLYIYDENYNTSDISLWKAYLAEQYANGTPITVLYALATEEVTDITDLFTEDNSIEVEGGGTLRFVNEHEIPVPNTVVYVAKAPTLSLDGVKAKLNNLIAKANSTTGKSDTDLTSGMNSLIEGYGKGGSSEGTPIPIGENVERIYFNVNNSVAKTVDYLSKLTYTNHPLLGDVYGIFGRTSDPNRTKIYIVLIFKDNDHYSIHAITDLSSFEMVTLFDSQVISGDEGYFNGWQKAQGFRYVSSTGFDITIDSIGVKGSSLSEFEGVSIGLENETLKNVLSATPFTASVNEGIKVGVVNLNSKTTIERISEDV